jgi:hypothetical protein
MSLASPTFGQLIDLVLSNLHGMTSDLEQLTNLTQDIQSTDLSFTVDDASQVTRGLIEIDSELMWVKSVDQQNNIVTLASFGRGFRETTASTHTNGTMVMNNPRFPRLDVSTAIQQTLYAVYPDLFQVKTDESNTVVPIQVAYPLPADCDLIIDVRWKNIGGSSMWTQVRRYQEDTRADATAFPTGKSVEIFDGMAPGQPIKVTYVAQPGQLVAEADLLSTTGLSDSCQDVLIYGACYRLLSSLEVSRLQTYSIEQSERSMLVPPGSATQASKYYFGLYSQALQREATSLQKFLPNKTHLVR